LGFGGGVELSALFHAWGKSLSVFSRLVTGILMGRRDIAGEASIAMAPRRLPFGFRFLGDLPPCACPWHRCLPPVSELQRLRLANVPGDAILRV
jgi:hypothetical protein